MAGRWPMVEAALDELQLDVLNVRIPGSQADQDSVMRYLVEAEEVLSLAHDILRDGYIDIEPLVVVREDDKLVVLEGNRRTAALKCIQDRTAAGTRELQMARLLSRYPHHDVPTDVRITLAPSRAEASPLLARLHTGDSKRQWGREQMAVFYHAQLEGSTTTVDDLKERYPGLGARVVRFIKMGEMRSLVQAMRYDDAELGRWVKSGQMSMSTFEYAYKARRILAALGLSFDKNGLLTSHTLSAGQRHALEYLLARFREKSLSTRSAELIASSPGGEHDALVETLHRLVTGAPLPESDSPGDTGGEDRHDDLDRGDDEAADRESRDESQGGADVGGGQNGSRGVGVRGPNRGDTRERLNFAGLAYDNASHGMRRRYEELRRISVRDFPNAAYDLMRTVLECAIKDHLRAHGRTLSPRSTLGDHLKELRKEFASDARLAALVDQVRARDRTGRELSGTADALNYGNHEPDFFVTQTDAHDAWERLLPILVELERQRPAS